MEKTFYFTIDKYTVFSKIIVGDEKKVEKVSIVQ